MEVGDDSYTKDVCEKEALLNLILRDVSYSPLRMSKGPSLKDKETACGSFVVSATINQKVRDGGINLRYSINSNVFARLKKKLGKKRELIPFLERKLNVQAKVSAYIDYVIKNEIKVTDEEIDFIHRSIKRSNEVAMATNAVVYALASNVWVEAQSKKVKFDVLAVKYDTISEERKPGEWGEFTATDLEDESALLKAIRDTPKGGISPLVETSEGLVIVKVEDKMGFGRAVDINKNPERYVLKKILFPLAVSYKEETVEETRANIFKHKRRKRGKEILDQLIKGADIRYPNGNVIWKER